jgi:hypothetical protein
VDTCLYGHCVFTPITQIDACGNVSLVNLCQNCTTHNGICVCIAKTCDDGDGCTYDSCNALTGLCSHSPRICPDRLCYIGLGCIDGSCTYSRDMQTCDSGEICNETSGMCVPVQSDPNPVGLCIPAAGDPCQVYWRSTPNGPCTAIGPKNCSFNPETCTTDVCEQSTGACVPATEPYCDDGNDCTIDKCVSSQCMHIQLECGPSLDPCNNVSCVAGQCVSSRVSCAYLPQLNCQIPSCLLSTGACGYIPLNCNNGDLCSNSSCDNNTGLCMNVQKSCDDGDICTHDYCNSTTGECIHDSGIPGLCNSSDSSAASASPRTPQNCGLHGCDDGDVCTYDWCESSTHTCRHASIDCPQRPCHISDCVRGIGCVDVALCPANYRCDASLSVCNEIIRI